MNIYTELPTAFPWYDNILKQNRFRENVEEKAPNDWALISPKNALLPFQFYKPTADTITAWGIYDLSGNLVQNVSSFAAIKTATKRGYTYHYYNGSALGFTLQPGIYYSRINFTTGYVYYSEIFQIPACSFGIADANEFLKLEWWNEADIAPIFYNDFTAGVPYFKNVVYLDTFVHQSEPEIIEDGEKDGNDETIPTFTKALLRYRITELVPDFLKVALVLMQMHDNKFLTTRKAIRYGEMNSLTTNTAPEPSGALSVVDILFEDIIMVKKGCGENMGATGTVIVPPPPPPPPTTTYNTVLTFQSSASASAEGVGATAAGTNGNLKFEFDKITPLSGTPNSMEIRIGGSAQLIVDFPSDYNGRPFRFTSTAGTIHTSNFVGGVVNF